MVSQMLLHNRTSIQNQYSRLQMKLSLRALSLTSCVAVLLVAAGTANADIVTNGTFSSGLSGWTTAGSGTTPGIGITVINFSNTVPATQFGDIIPNAPGGTTHGVYFVDDNTTNEVLSQNVTLAANTTYSLTFDLWATNSGAGNAGNFLLKDAVGTIASSSFGNAAQAGSSTVPVGAWTLETLQFTTGAATSYALDFDWNAGGTPSKDVVLTNVAINSAVPEPSSIVLLGSGLLAAAGVIRRRFAA
jgi:hypothetical protein